MGQALEAKIGRKYAIYLPKAIVKELDLKEGEKVLLSVSGKTVVVQSLEDPIKLALSGEKFSSITSQEAERISLEQQRRAVKGTR
jgi:AbrB family looped-hinge helix DNA binding protein